MIALTAWRAGLGVLAPLACFAAGTAVAPLGVVAWLGVAGALPAWRAIVLEYLIPLYSRLGRTAEWNVYRPYVWIPIAAGALGSLAGALAGRRFGRAARGRGAGRALRRRCTSWGRARAGSTTSIHSRRSRSCCSWPGCRRAGRRGWPTAMAGDPRRAPDVRPPRRQGARRQPRRLGARQGRRRARGSPPRSRRCWRPGDTVQVFDTTAGGVHALLRLRRASADALPVRLSLLPRRRPPDDPGAARRAPAGSRRPAARADRAVRAGLAGRRLRALRRLPRAGRAAGWGTIWCRRARATASMHSATVKRIIRAYDDPIVRAYCWARFGILRQRFLDEIGQYLPDEGPGAGHRLRLRPLLAVLRGVGAATLRARAGRQPRGASRWRGGRPRAWASTTSPTRRATPATSRATAR